MIIGRSNIVGKPMGAILIQNELGANATVTICHSRTKSSRCNHTSRHFNSRDWQALLCYK